jgi:hypothetical protein
MPETEASAEKSSAAIADFSLQFAEMGKKTVDAIANLQKEFFDSCEEMNRDWFARARSEATLASELASKLANCRTIPETASAWQEWMDRHTRMLAEDGRRLFTGSQKYMQAGARLLSNGPLGGGT